MENTKLEFITGNFSKLRMYNVVAKVGVTYPLSLSTGIVKINTEKITPCWQLPELRMQLKKCLIS
jgi:hypothetical protein